MDVWASGAAAHDAALRGCAAGDPARPADSLVTHLACTLARFDLRPWDFVCRVVEVVFESFEFRAPDA